MGAVEFERRCWRFGQATLDERTLELWVGGRPIAIERKPLEILLFLLRHAGEIVTKDAILEAVWPGRVLSESVLTKAIAKLRAALGDESQAIIRTLHGFGYRLTAPVQVESSANRIPGASSTKPIPETRFAAVGNDRVAYQVFGQGPPDVLLTGGPWSHQEVPWEDPAIARFYRRVGSGRRLIRFDGRGSGLSDHPTPDGRSRIDHWIDDCSEVLRIAAAPAPVIISTGAAPFVLQFLDRYPDRCSALVLINGSACQAARPDYPEGASPEDLARMHDFTTHYWGREEFGAVHNPSQAGNPEFLEWFAKYLRAIAPPRALAESLTEVYQFDSRPVLARIRIPTLVMARRNSPFRAQSRYMAAHLPAASFVDLPGFDALPFWEATDEILDHIDRFIAGCLAGA